jgi:hypothetical protein
MRIIEENTMILLLDRVRPGVRALRIDQSGQTNCDPNGNGDNSIEGIARVEFDHDGKTFVAYTEADPRQDVDPYCVIGLAIMVWTAEHGLPNGYDPQTMEPTDYCDILLDMDDPQQGQFVDFTREYVCGWEMVEYEDDEDDEDEE